ncbi:MAG TPA: cellulase family glycosylhydrolase [Capsulimonadaceae bacterium]|jgi:aryl-phospho-beta-D-glucosidase BglC (GH1 family)
MKNIFTALCTTMLLAILTPCAPVCAQYLHAEATTMRDATGKPIILRSMNTGAWLTYEPFWYDGGANLADNWNQDPERDTTQTFTPVVTQMLEGAAPGHTVDSIKKAFYDNFFTEPDVKLCKELGFNSLRVCFDVRLLCTQASWTVSKAGQSQLVVVDPKAIGWTYLDNVVRWCSRNGVYAILDMHLYPIGFSDDPKALAAMCNVWAAIASRYQHDRFVGGYDLMNEPGWGSGKFSNIGTGVPENHTNPGMNYSYQQMIDSIRRVDRNHMIIVEGFMTADRLDNFFYDASNTVHDSLQIVDPCRNLALSFHKYGGAIPENYENVLGDGPAVPDNGPDGSHYWWDAPKNLWMIAHMKKLASMANVPLWMGEFGNNQNYWMNLAAMQCERSADVRDASGKIIEKNLNVPCGWAVWTYKKGGYGVAVNAPPTEGMQKLNRDYWNALKSAYAHKKPLPLKPAYMTPEWTYSTLLMAAQKTNFRYCEVNTSFVDSVTRDSFNKQAVPFDPRATLPGKVRAVNYDMGANYYNGRNLLTTLKGAAYNTGSLSNGSWNCRLDGVAINWRKNAVADGVDGFEVDNFRPGDWLKYTLTAKPGKYTCTVRYAAGATPGSVRLLEAGRDISGLVTLPPTEGMSTYSTVSFPVVVSKSGPTQFQFENAADASGSGFNFSWWELSKPSK